MQALRASVGTPIDFTWKQVTLDNDDPELEYQRRSQDQKTAIHWGQRKLLMTEVQFLTIYCNVDNPIVVYAGAAPGHHIPIISRMFPSITWHLYDPRKFVVKPTDKIKVHQQYFMGADALEWAGRDNVFFLSDIRTADHISQEAEENERRIVEDLLMQQEWIRIMEPIQSQIKFRLPYIKGYNNERYLEYMDGTIYLQAWAPVSSTETRLVPNGLTKTYDNKKYEDQMFYHNSIIREAQRYNVHTSDELRNDYDSALEQLTIQAYLYKTTGRTANFSEIATFSEGLTKALNGGKPKKNWLISLNKIRSNPHLIRSLSTRTRE